MSEELVASGTQTAPSAGLAVATLAAPPAGKYKVEINCTVSGVAVGDLGNFRLRRQGVDFMSPVPQGSNGEAGPTVVIDEMDLSGAQNLTLEAIGAGTASIEYNGTIQALRIGVLS